MSSAVTEQRELATRLPIEAILRLAREIGGAAWEEHVERIIATVAPVIPEKSSFHVRPGESVYEDSNWCSTCRRVYPKEIRVCPLCHRQLRTKPRR